MGKTTIISKEFRNVRKPRMNLTHARSIAKIEKQYQIVELRRNGLTIKQIADRLGLGVVVVSRELHDILDNTIIKYQETTEQARQIQLDQIDMLIKTYSELATKEYNVVMRDPTTLQEVIVVRPPDPAYAKLLLSCMDRKARLMALDMPEVKKLELTGIREYIGVDMDKV